MPNPGLKWEVTKQTDIGLDFGLFKNRITIVFDYYKRLTEDLLISLPIPPSNGVSSYSTNRGSIENKGYEFDLKASILDKKMKWDIGGNISLNRNKVIDIGGADSFTGPVISAVGGQSLHICKVGYPIGSYYGYRIIGIYQNQEEIDAGPTDSSNPTPGSFKYKDINGDGEITADDREIIGNPFPDFIFGLYSDIEWKRFMLSILLQGSIGQDVINANRHNLDALCAGNALNARQEAYDNRWRGEGTSNTYPQATSSSVAFNDRFTDFIVEDGSYARIKNISLSYRFLTRKASFCKNAKLFISATNLLTLTRYKGYDPEINSRGDNALAAGVDNGSIPQYRVFSVGINIEF